MKVSELLNEATVKIFNGDLKIKNWVIDGVNTVRRTDVWSESKLASKGIHLNKYHGLFSGSSYHILLDELSEKQRDTLDSLTDLFVIGDNQLEIILLGKIVSRGQYGEPESKLCRIEIVNELYIPLLWMPDGKVIAIKIDGSILKLKEGSTVDPTVFL